MVINLPKNPCAICCKNEVEVLCDFVTDYDNQPIFVRNYKDFVALNGQVRHETCDMPMCRECAMEHNNAHFCTYHAEMLKNVNITDETLKKRIGKFKMKNREWF
jgi:hypothetical protein